MLNTILQRGSFTKDLLASIVVFLTALPLCMGIAIASGVPVDAGLITGIVGGLIVGFCSGSELQVSGPAAGLSVIVLEIVQSQGMEGLAIIMIIAGVFQIIGGMAKLGQVFRAVSPSDVNGMMTGIGLLIFLSQIYVMCDLAPMKTPLKNIAGIPDLVAKAFAGGESSEAALLGLIGVTIAVLWMKLPKKFGVVPAALISVTSVSLIAAIRHSPVHFVEVPANLLSAVHMPNFGLAEKLGFWSVLEDAFALALIASAETLLSATALDRMHTGPRTKFDRELVAQGIGNTICGMIGALPMTGVIARSSVNIYAGAMTRKSAILHGLWLLLFVTLLPGLIRLVPVASLAALLLVIAYKLVDVAAIRKLWAYGYRLVGIYAATVIGIICTDLLTGVLVGVVLSLAKLLYTMSRLDIEKTSEIGSRRITLNLHGAATFVSLPKLTNALEDLPANCELHVKLDELNYLDHACMELLTEWGSQHTLKGGSVVIDWGELNAAFRQRARRRMMKAAEAAQASDSGASAPSSTPTITTLAGAVSENL